MGTIQKFGTEQKRYYGVLLGKAVQYWVKHGLDLNDSAISCIILGKSPNTSVL